MRTEFLCISVLRVASGSRVKLLGRKSALTPHPPAVYSADRSKAMVLVLVLFFVALWFILFSISLIQLTLLIPTSLISNNRLSPSENLITGNKILWKRGEIFSSFPQCFQYISNFKSPITYTYVKCGCSIYFFLNSANLICRSTDISKYFRESLGIRDNESRLY